MKRHLWVIVLGCLLPIAAGADIIDDFEDGDVSDWYDIGSGTPMIRSATAAAAHDGNYGLETRDAGGGPMWIYRNDAGAQVAQGNTISWWTQLNNASNTRNYLGFGATPAGCYSAICAPNTTSFMIQRNDGYGYTTLAEYPYANWIRYYWYRVEVVWGVGGLITANLYDSDGVTLLATVSAVDNTYTAGGVAFRAFDDNMPVYLDSIMRDCGPSPTAHASWGQVKNLFR